MNNNQASLKLPIPLKFWYQHFVKGEGTYEQSLKPVAVISTVEEFWAYYQHFKKPTELPIGSYIYLFKETVVPAWQDQHNKHGGAFVLRFQRSKINRLWQDVLLSFISAKPQITKQLNGVRMKVKKDNAEIHFWITKMDNDEVLETIREWIVGVTTLQNDTPLELVAFEAEE